MLLLAAAVAPLPSHAAEGVDIARAGLESTEDGYKLSIAFSFSLTRSLEEAVMRGIPLYFTTEVQISRPRWYWFDEKTVNTAQTIRISYNVLTHQYHASISGRLQQSFSSLDDALSLVRRPARWVIAEKDALKSGEVYNVAVRMGLDIARLPKPFQVHALNSSDWRFSSDWTQFSFRAE
ncbi:DUF4390 domain-containing protein [Noviherbaspirillum agri]